MAEHNFKVLDLFSGCGGLSYGFHRAGYEVLLGIDSWDVALETFTRNHGSAKGLIGDLASMSPKAAEEELRGSKIDVIVGGPPCQGFSISGKRIADDPRNKLYISFVKFVEHFRPKAFLMENVPNLLSVAQGRFREEILGDFSKLGYSVTYKTLLASDFGVPQNRKRVFFVGLLNGGKFEFPEATHGPGLADRITTKEAISDLPEKTLASGTPYPCKALSEYQAEMRRGSTGVFNHETVIHTEKTRSIIELVPDGGNYKNLPAELRNTRRVNIAWTRFASNKPSLTIDTGHNHHFHYEFNRVPTPREAARLQSFPDSFVFAGTKNETLKQIGNAVPPLLGAHLAKALKKHL